ncbi:hypothetical protein R3P38DRAFT_578667 [Favolaschia claudopus]|uniref:DUF3730 domain-containing protein n=1 Tax=Favolaschia claudopus TaxID=2862362 RepID=A0AAV9Z9A4_9AGAR
MLSLRFQESSPSLLSYWSDNMSVGPNLPLHALSKPAIRYLYQSQVKKFMKAIENRPLSEEMMAIFESYLGYKYISSATKCMIVDHLSHRLQLLGVHDCLSAMELVCRCSPSLVEAMESASAFNSPLSLSVSVFQDIAPSKLQDWVTENQTPNVLKALEYFSFTYRHCLPAHGRPPIIHNILEKLRLLPDDCLLSFASNGLSLIQNIHDFSARTAAFVAIFQRASAQDSPPVIRDLTLDLFTFYIGSRPDFARQVLDVISSVGFRDQTNSLIMKSLAVDRNLIPDLLRNPACTYEMCAALERLAPTHAASVIILELELHLILIKLLLEPIDTIIQCAVVRVLHQICIWEAGAEAVALKSNMLQVAEKLLGSEDTSRETSDWLHAIAQHKSTYHAILSPDLIRLLFLLLSDTTFAITRCAALRALQQMCIWEAGAEAVALESGMNTYTTQEVLKSPDTAVALCNWLEVVAHRQHKATMYPSILSVELFQSLVKLLRTPVMSQCAALRVLHRICTWDKGVLAVVIECNIPRTAKRLLTSQDTAIVTCHWLQAIAQHSSTYHSILSAELIKQLFQLLRFSNTTTAISQCAALQVLHQICVWAEGAEAVVFQSCMLDTSTTIQLLSSEHTIVAVCDWLQAIAQHKSTYHSILSAELIKQLLRHTATANSQHAALRVLHQICIWSYGAEAVVFECTMLRTAKKLLRSQDTSPNMYNWLYAIAQHKSTYHAILSPDLIELLIGLSSKDGLTDSHNETSLSTLILREVARWPDGAKAITRVISSISHADSHHQEDSAYTLITHLARCSPSKFNAILNATVSQHLVQSFFAAAFSSQHSLVEKAAYVLRSLCLMPNCWEVVGFTGLLGCLPKLIQLVDQDEDVNACIVLMVQLGQQKGAAA